MDWTSEIGAPAIAAIIAGVVLTILSAYIEPVRRWLEKAWVGGAVAGVIAVLILSDVLREPSGTSNLPQGAIVAFAAVSCPPEWERFLAANGRMIVGIDGRSEYAVTFPHVRPVFATGGEDEITLAQEQIPRHDHGLGDFIAIDRFIDRVHIRDGDGEDNPIDLIYGANRPYSQYIYTGGDYGEDEPNRAIRFRGSISTTSLPDPNFGGRSSFDNRPPYIALYWCTPVPETAG